MMQINCVILKCTDKQENWESNDDENSSFALSIIGIFNFKYKIYHNFT